MHGWLVDAWRTLWRPDAPAASITLIVTAMLALAGLIMALLDYVGVVAVQDSLVLAVLSLLALDAVIQTTRREALIESAGSLHERLSNTVDRAGELRQVPPTAIRSELMDQLRSADRWIFRGGSASWIRQEALPALARLENQRTDVHSVLVDPRDATLCAVYANYRYQSRRMAPVHTPGRADPADIQSAILATIYELGWYSLHSRIRPHVALTEHFSPVRVDGTNSALIFTVADLRQPGLVAQASSWFFNAMRDDVLSSFEGGSALVSLQPDRELYPVRPESVDADVVRVAISRMVVKEPDGGAGMLIQEDFPPDWDQVTACVLLGR